MSAPGQRIARRRVFAAGLAVALVHQLGACPCGCLDGNRWLQTYLQMTGRVAAKFAAPLGDVSTGPHVEVAECVDDHSSIVYVTSNSSTAPDSYSGGFAALAPPAANGSLAWQPCPESPHVVADDQQFPGDSARTLRAQLQVFLI